VNQLGVIEIITNLLEKKKSGGDKLPA